MRTWHRRRPLAANETCTEAMDDIAFLIPAARLRINCFNLTACRINNAHATILRKIIISVALRTVTPSSSGIPLFMALFAWLKPLPSSPLLSIPCPHRRSRSGLYDPSARGIAENPPSLFCVWRQLRNRRSFS